MYIPMDDFDTILKSLDHSVQNRPHVVSQIPRIATLMGGSGSGKTALIDYWLCTATQVMRADEVVRIWLSPASNEYRSMSHMVLARILDELHRLFAPAYAPIRSRPDEADRAERFGKNQLEVLRKKVDRELARRPIRVLVIDNVHHIDQHALHYLLRLRMELFQGQLVPKRALILVGQEQKSVKPERQLLSWLNQSEAQSHYTEQHQLKYPTKKEQKTIIKRLIEEGLDAQVPDNDFRVQVNREIGQLVDATEGNWFRLEQFIRLIDDWMPPSTDGSARCITPEVLRQVRAILGKS